MKTIIHMPTGSAKTKTVLASLLEYNLKTKFLHDNFIIWLAHSDELCDQAKESFKKLWSFYGTIDLPLIRLKDQSLEEIKLCSKGVIICSYAKLHKLRVSNEGSKILEYIRRKGISIKSAALDLGVTADTINKIYSLVCIKSDQIC